MSDEMTSNTTDPCDHQRAVDRCLREIVETLRLTDYLDRETFERCVALGVELRQGSTIDDTRLARFLVFGLAEELSDAITREWARITPELDERVQQSLEDAAFPRGRPPVANPVDWCVDYPLEAGREDTVVMAGLGYASGFARALEPDGIEFIEKTLASRARRARSS